MEYNVNSPLHCKLSTFLCSIKISYLTWHCIASRYQKSNNGNFPSLNLTHKEVGGSFYTVREIVREIIQENRVLGPAKLFSEDDDSRFLEKHPVGSISFDPQNGLPLSDKTNAVKHAPSNQDEITSGDHIFNFNLQFHGTEPVALDNKPLVNELSNADEKDGGSDEPRMSQKCVDDQIVNDSEMFEKDQECHKPTIANTIPIPRDTTCETSVLSSGMFRQPESQRLSDEQILDKSSQINEPTKAVTYMEAVAKEILDREKDIVKELETSEAIMSHKKPEDLVETFPLTAVSKRIHDMDEEDSKLSDVSGTLEDRATHHEGIMFTKSLSALTYGKVEEKLPSLGSSDIVTTAEATTLDGSIVKNVEAKDSMPDGTKACDSPQQPILKESTAVVRKPYVQDNGSFQKESNPMLDRINLETWEGTSKKSPDPNPLLTLLKGFISAFVKFWTE
ncbi:uncharacterized protein LOC111373580 [Olea europaea var. sylvestris]|uniref:uncharacterized protein LOC111373580 n=1 Tax=Olea europaea var. sylvestris TaxID=158386 RepID=UPI000C1CFB14|nr:uncharacterized protein LOC111373580 [Olea europaea var. sylvestris]